MFNKIARKKASAPAARRKAAITRKRNLFLKQKEQVTKTLGKGKTTVFNISDLPGERPTGKTRKPYTTKVSILDRIQLIRELLAIITQVLK